MAQYSSQTTAPTPDNIYFDVTATNFGDFGADPPTFQYNEKRAIPYLQCPEDYYLSVIRFTCETGTLPVFIPTINPPDKNQIYKGGAAALQNPGFTAGQETIYQVGMSVATTGGGEVFATQNVMWLPQDLNASMPPYNNGMTYQDWILDGSTKNLGNYSLNTDKYYNCYSYHYLMSLIQNAITLCYTKLGNNYNTYMSKNMYEPCLLGTPTTDSLEPGGKDYTPLFPVCPQIYWSNDTNSAKIVVDTDGWTSNVSKNVGDLAVATKLLNYVTSGIQLVGSTNFIKMPATNNDVVQQRTSNIQSLAFYQPPNLTLVAVPDDQATQGTIQYYVKQPSITTPLPVGSVSTTNQTGASMTITVPIGIQTTGDVHCCAWPGNTPGNITLTHTVSAPALIIYKNGVYWKTVTPSLLRGGATTIKFPLSLSPILFETNNPNYYNYNISQGSFLGTYQITIPVDYGLNQYSFSFQANLETKYGDNPNDIFNFNSINLTTSLLYNTSFDSQYVDISTPGWLVPVNWQGQPSNSAFPNGPAALAQNVNKAVTILPTGYLGANATFAAANPPVPNPSLNIVGNLKTNLNPLSYSALNFNLFFNPALYQLLSGFSAMYQKPWASVDDDTRELGYLPQDSVNSSKYYFPCAYKLNFHNLGNTNTQNFSSSLNTPSKDYTGAYFYQEYSSVHNISPITSLVFCSNTLPVVSSQVSTPLVYSNGSAMVQAGLNADTANIITDLTLPPVFGLRTNGSIPIHFTRRISTSG